MSYAMSAETPVTFAREVTFTTGSSLSASAPRVSRRQWRTGAGLSGIAALFLLFDATLKLLSLPAAVQGTVQLGYPASVLMPLGIIELACLIVYVVPRISPLGAVLWTGYLGGAIATHVRVGDPLFTHVMFPIYVAAMLWGGLWLRDARVRGLLARRAR